MKQIPEMLLQAIFNTGKALQFQNKNLSFTMYL